MKEKLIMFGLSAAWAAGVAVFVFVMALKYNQISMQADINFLMKDSENSVKKDVYETDKLLTIERMRK